MDSDVLLTVDESLIEGRGVPAAFQEDHALPPDAAEFLGITEEELWQGVASGAILRPVPLPTNPQAAVWSWKVLKQWDALNRPADLYYAVHRTMVLNSLLQSIRDELSPNPPTVSERN